MFPSASCIYVIYIKAIYQESKDRKSGFDRFHQILNKTNKCVSGWVRLYLYSICGATANKKYNVFIYSEITRYLFC